VSADVSIDGGGVVADTPLPLGTRIRLSPTGYGEQDITVYVEGTAVHVTGFKRALRVNVCSPNHITIETREVHE
jgi:hypothetical protein